MDEFTSPATGNTKRPREDVVKGAIITEHRQACIRFLSERQAAIYAGMTLKEFRRKCSVPADERDQGRKVWDVCLLDEWLDHRSKTEQSGAASHQAILDRLHS